MADYREISQSYAQGAIKAAFAINGGAAVVVLSQLGSLSELIDPKKVACALLIYDIWNVIQRSSLGDRISFNASC